jgi:hypothetical protein
MAHRTSSPFHRPPAVGVHARGEAGRALARKLAAELIGTFFLVFTGGTAAAKTGAGALAPLAIRQHVDGHGLRRRPHLPARTTTRR